jgi:hypothetical protein
VWGALASSDFHSIGNGDYWPCQFSATWVYAPDRSIGGVLQALKAGSFVGEHGHIVRDAEFTLAGDGLPRKAVPGEVVHVPSGRSVRLELRATIPAVDWAGRENRIDSVEFIGSANDGTSVLHGGPLDARGAIVHDFTVPSGGIAVRARGYRVVEDGPDLLFYTNPIRVR